MNARYATPSRTAHLVVAVGAALVTVTLLGTMVIGLTGEAHSSLRTATPATPIMSFPAA